MWFVLVVADGVFERAYFDAAESLGGAEGVVLDTDHEFRLDRLELGIPGDIDQFAHEGGAEAALPVFGIDDYSHFGVMAAGIAAVADEDAIGADAFAIEGEEREGAVVIEVLGPAGDHAFRNDVVLQEVALVIWYALKEFEQGLRIVADHWADVDDRACGNRELLGESRQAVNSHATFLRCRRTPAILVLDCAHCAGDGMARGANAAAPSGRAGIERPRNALRTGASKRGDEGDYTGVSERVLIAYSSKHGSTAVVAAAIGRRLEKSGFRVDVECAEEVRSLAQYEGVVVGSPLYAGHWQRQTMAFLRKHRDELARKPVAVFALGPRGRPGEEEWEKAERQLSAVLRKHPWLRPVARKMVGGVIEPSRLRFPFSHMPACDWRDWAAIDAWADSLPGLLLSGAKAVSGAA